MTETPFLIAGGGIGGLAAAIALRHAGCPVVVLERAESFSEVGAGLTMTAPGLRALDALGVLAETLRDSDSAAGTAFIHHATGEIIRISPPSAASVSGDPTDQTRILHRSDMHAILLRQAQSLGAVLVPGAALAGFQQSAGGVIVMVQDGRRFEGAALIGADGLRSHTRMLLRGDGMPRPTGVVAWRCLLPVADVADLLGGFISAVHIGPGATFVRYQVRHGTVLNCVAIVRSSVTAAESWSTPSNRAELAAQFTGWHAGLHALIDRTPDSLIYKWPLFDRAPIENWSEGRVTLLGDAAHPMLPFLGIGATMALEDAVLLGQAVASTPDIVQALALYAATRAPRAVEVNEASRKQGEMIMGAGVTETFRKELKPAEVFAYDPRRTAASAALG